MAHAASALQLAFKTAMDAGAARARELHARAAAVAPAAAAAESTTGATTDKAPTTAVQDVTAAVTAGAPSTAAPRSRSGGVVAPAAEVAAWLRAGMAATAPRLPGNQRANANGRGLSERYEEEAAKSAAKAADKWDVDAAARARAEIKAEFEAEELSRTNRQLKGMVVGLRDQLKATQSKLAEAESRERAAQPLPQYEAREQSATTEELYRRKTAELIASLMEQLKLAEQREVQKTAALEFQLEEAERALQAAEAENEEKVRAKTLETIGSWLSSQHGLHISAGDDHNPFLPTVTAEVSVDEVDLARRVVAAFEEMEIPLAQWLPTLESFDVGTGELAEFLAELPPAAAAAAAAAAPEPAPKPEPEPELDETPRQRPRAARRRITATAESAQEVAPTPPRRAASKGAWDAVPTRDSRLSMNMLASMGPAAVTHRWRVAPHLVAEDVPNAVFDVTTAAAASAVKYTEFGSASLVGWACCGGRYELYGLVTSFVPL